MANGGAHSEIIWIFFFSQRPL